MAPPEPYRGGDDGSQPLSSTPPTRLPEPKPELEGQKPALTKSQLKRKKRDKKAKNEIPKATMDVLNGSGREPEPEPGPGPEPEPGNRKKWKGKGKGKGVKAAASGNGGHQPTGSTGVRPSANGVNGGHKRNGSAAVGRNQGQSSSTLPVRGERRNGASELPSTNEIEYNSDTSCTLAAEPSPNNGASYHPPPFERNGIFFGNHPDSADPTRSSTPAHAAYLPTPYYPMPQHMPYEAPYGYYTGQPHVPTFQNQYFSPHGDVNTLPPGYSSPDYPAPYPYPMYSTPSYRYPTYGVPFPPYGAPGQYTPYSPEVSPVHFGHEAWPQQSGNENESPMPASPAPDEGESRARTSENEGSNDEHQPANPADTYNSGLDSENGVDEQIEAPVTADTSRHGSPGKEENIGRDVPVSMTTGVLGGGNDLQSLSQYLLSAFETGEWADYRLFLESSTGYYTVSYSVHRLLVARSPSFYSRMQEVELGGLKDLNAVSGDSFVQPKAFRAALQNLYGLPLVSEDQLSGGAFQKNGHEGHLAVSDSDNTHLYQERMDFALCYAASGAFLGHTDILRHGVHLAAGMINWDTVELVFRFALIPQSFTITWSDSFESQSGKSISSGHGFTESRTGNTDDPATKKPRSSYAFHNTLNEELVEVYAPDMLHKALEFVAANINPNFKLDTEAQPTAIPNWLPDVSVRSNSGSPIKFGALQDGTETRDRHTTVASAIMLSLQFKQLRKLLKFLRANGRLTRQLAEDIVAERERRRLRALRVLSARDGGITDDTSIPSPLGWEESLNVVSDGTRYNQISVVKTWRGSYTGPLVFG